MTNTKQIRALRKQRGWSQAELAKRLGGITPSAVAQWERGWTQPGKASLQALVRVLNVPLSTFLAEGDDRSVENREHAALPPHLDQAVLEQAAELGIDAGSELSLHLARLVSQKRAELWLEENRAALASANEFLDRYGLWSDGKRLF